MLEIYTLAIDTKIRKDDFDCLSGFVSEEKKIRLIRFHRFEDAQRSLFGDILARYAICRRTGLRNGDLVFRKNDYGKPMLIQPKGIYFNISHSGIFVVCAIDDRPVGIDVEEIKTMDMQIAKNYFTTEEYNGITSLPKDKQTEHFYDLWTLKESFIKADGRGLNIPLDSFSISKNSNRIILTSGEKEVNCYFKQLDIASEYKLSVCVLGMESKFGGLHAVDINSILETFKKASLV